MSDYYKAKKTLEEIRCNSCHGSGKVDDMEPGDISYNEWTCPDCEGTGLVKEGTGAAAMSEWQPIETAPDDGTVVDLWIVAGGCEFRATDFKFDNGRWEGETSDEPLEWHYMNARMRPTHWMHLPEPPQ